MINLWDGKSAIKARALLLGERIDLKGIEMVQRLAIAPTVVSVGTGGIAAFFRYGAVVLFELQPLEQAAFVESLRPFLVEPFTPVETEEVTLRLTPDQEEQVSNGVITLLDYSLPRLQIIADTLAKSVVLAHYEQIVAGAFDLVEPMAARLHRWSWNWQMGNDLPRHIGDMLLMQHQMVGRAEVDEKPEILWDHPELERLFHRLSDEYELRERHVALERKLELISRTVQTLLDLLQAQRSLRVEWYVVALIVVEILLTLYELFVRG